VPVAAAGFLGLGLARRAAGPDLDARSVHDVLRGLAHNVTTDMDLELWAVAMRLDAESAEALRASPADLALRYRAGTLPAVLQRELAAFLAEYGHRTAAEIDLGMPRWSDDPTQVLGSLANYRRLAEADPAEHPDVRFSRGAAAAEATVAEVVARVARRSRIRAAIAGFGLRRTRQLAGMRETHKDYLVRVLAHARAQLAIIGAELAERGLLAEAADVFFLELRDVKSALDGADQRGVVATRRAEYDRELRRRHIPRVLLSDGTEPEALAAPPPEGALIGTPASAGTVSGRARVVLDPAEATLEPGEILVAPSTDPGWTPLFLTAGGLVMEMGGANSHGAVVAREYGIPAVVGVPDATARLHTGQTVTVDGASGTITVDG
jgi:pyruvate,water dikinase